jgi:hypothetical protein
LLINQPSGIGNPNAIILYLPFQNQNNNLPYLRLQSLLKEKIEHIIDQQLELVKHKKTPLLVFTEKNPTVAIS